PLDREGGPSLVRISSGQGLLELREVVGEDAAVAASSPPTPRTTRTHRFKRKLRQAPLSLATGAFGCHGPPKPLADPGSTRRVSDLLRLPRGDPERRHAVGHRLRRVDRLGHRAHRPAVEAAVRRGADRADERRDGTDRRRRVVDRAGFDPLGRSAVEWATPTGLLFPLVTIVDSRLVLWAPGTTV